MVSKKAVQKQNRPVSEGFFRAHWRQAKAALSNLGRRPFGTILTLAVLSMSLALPTAFYIAGKNLTGVAHGMEAASQVSVYLQTGTAEARVMVLKDQIETWSEVGSVKYISAKQGLEDISQFSGLTKAMSLLEDTILPPVLVVTPKSDSQDTQSARQLAEKLQQQDSVTDVRLDEDWFARLDAIKRVAYVVAISFATLMLVSVFLIVGNTLRFNILAHKQEIQVMKLIGATDRFILRPYLYTGLWLGLLASGIAWLLTMLISYLVQDAVMNLAKLYDSHFILEGLDANEGVLLLMLGSFLSLFAANMSARRHLREIEPV
ncbi:MAG: permease-like cell division protein FtsX [Vibrio sp.]